MLITPTPQHHIFTHMLTSIMFYWVASSQWPWFCPHLFDALLEWPGLNIGFLKMDVLHVVECVMVSLLPHYLMQMSFFLYLLIVEVIPKVIPRLDFQCLLVPLLSIFSESAGGEYHRIRGVNLVGVADRLINIVQRLLEMVLLIDELHKWEACFPLLGEYKLIFDNYMIIN